MQHPIRVAIMGMGGFAGEHHDAVRRLESEGVCRLVCTCDPRMEAFAERREVLQFAGRKVGTFADYREMLAACGSSLDAVTIPTPVPLHAPMHRACVERGLAVYLEKPPPLDYRELEGMIAAALPVPSQTNVGFNYIIEPHRQALKARMLAGEFGVVRRVTTAAVWPRPVQYYERAAWAGRLMMEGRLVLDSCMGNALAHMVHNALFFCGRGQLMSWGKVHAVTAELYRAHRIEGTDTVFVAAETQDGPCLRVAMSHAHQGQGWEEETTECERAVITYQVNARDEGGACQRFVIRWGDGREESGVSRIPDYLDRNLRQYFAYLGGEANRPVTRLEDSRPFVHLNDLAYIASGRITTVPDSAIRKSSVAGKDWVAIDGIEAIVRRFGDTGELPSSQGVPWATLGRRVAFSDLGLLESAVRGMMPAG